MGDPRGLLVVISGPSGAGKGTLRRPLLAAVPELRFSVSATTRPPRPGEVDGVNYHFWSRERFQQEVDGGRMLEWAEYLGNLYGTPREPVERLLAEGVDVLLEKEMQGAEQLKRRFPDGVFVFILPPSVDELRRRIMQRATEDPAEQQARLEKAIREIRSLPSYRYDYALVNDRVEDAVERLRAIILAERCRVSRQRAGWLERILEGRERDAECR